MKIFKALIIGTALLGSTLTYAADGSERSIKMNEKFRADQKRIHGTEPAATPVEELKVKATSQDRINTDIKTETNAD